MKVSIDKSIVEWVAGSTGVSTILSLLITWGMDWKIPAMEVYYSGSRHTPILKVQMQGV